MTELSRYFFNDPFLVLGHSFGARGHLGQRLQGAGTLSREEAFESRVKP